MKAIFQAFRDLNGGVKVVGLGTNHRLSLAQNPILLAGQITILLASCNRDVARLRKRRQVAGCEEVRAGDSESCAQFGRTPRSKARGCRSGADPRSP